MARNKKKKSGAQQFKKRQQKKLQRHKARRQHRRGSRVAEDFGTPNFGPDTIPSDLSTGIAPDLLADFGSGDIVGVMEVAQDTADLLNEPEFEEIELDPMLTTNTMLETMEEMGVDPEHVAPNEQMGEAFTEMIQTLVTPTLRQEIIQAAIAARGRLREAGDTKTLKKVAALQFVMQEDALSSMLPTVGLVQTLVQNGMEAGLALGELIQDVEQSSDDDLSPLEMGEHLDEIAVKSNLKEQLAQNPSFRRYLEKQVNKMEEESMKALFEAELRIDLYSQAELAEANKIVLDIFGQRTDDGGESVDEQATEDIEQAGVASPALDEETNQEAIEALNDYVIKIFTPERLATAQTQIETLLNLPEYGDSKWMPFLRTKYVGLGDDDAIDVERPFLLMALWGELKPYLMDPSSLADREEEQEPSESVTEGTA